jgi:hypothetical protein
MNGGIWEWVNGKGDYTPTIFHFLYPIFYILLKSYDIRRASAMRCPLTQSVFK